MALLFNRIRLKDFVKVPVRYRHGPDHWSVIKKKKTPKDKALEHFDEFYGSVYGNSWEEIRAALLKEETKYIAVVNNFSDVDKTRSDLELLGALHLKSVYDVQKEWLNDRLKSKEHIKNTESQNKCNPMETVIRNTQMTEVASLYPPENQGALQALKSEKEKDESIQKSDSLQPIRLQSIEEDLNDVSIDISRVVDSSVDVSTLHEFVPPTKIKGLDEWILESDHYKFYSKAADFKIDMVKESFLPFPEHLHPYTFGVQDNSTFSGPKKGSTGVLDYYLFDGASILPVLALDIQAGDVVLDMCAAPGGKTLTIIQTLMPSILVANDFKESRVQRIYSIMEQYLSNVYEKEKMWFVTEQDARAIEEKDVYNKILVDVPCTTDRHVLHSDDNNIFKPTRIKERLKIPEVQSEILANALRLVSVGGTVVYSTCSLSPVQNDGVVQVALKKTWEETDSVMVVKDMTEALSPLQSLFKFANIELKYGHIAVPTLKNNWGPMYFCKIVRVR